MSFAVLASLGTSCPQLRSLSLRRCPRLGEETEAVAILTGPALPHLEELDLTESGATDAVVNLVQFQCAQLRHLSVSGCDALTEFTSYLPQLTSLQLHGSAALRRVILHCPLVATITIESCPLLAAVTIKNATIRSIALHSCPELADVVLQCPKLNALDVCGTRVSDDVLTELAVECQQLRVVQARGCKMLTLKRLRRGVQLLL